MGLIFFFLTLFPQLLMPPVARLQNMTALMRLMGVLRLGFNVLTKEMPVDNAKAWRVGAGSILD